MNAHVDLETLTLTQGQQDAYDDFCDFLLDPKKNVFVLEGYAGTGKTTLVRTLLSQLPNMERSVRLIDPTFPGWDVQLTATTNKACEALSELTGEPAATIHSFLGLRVNKDYKTGETNLTARDWSDVKTNQLIMIDEASYLDQPTLRLIFQLTKNCKIVFIGDPAQLTNFKSKGAPVFQSEFPTARLTEVARQAEGNPIIELATAFRETVTTGEFFSFTPDGTSIQYMDRNQFAEAVKQEFTRPDWEHNDSKVLAWTNRAVIQYNHAIRDMAQGDPQFQAGDYAVLNSYLKSTGKYPLKTDELVQVTDKSELSEDKGTPGWWVQLNNVHNVFFPQSLDHRKDRIRRAKATNDLVTLRHIDQFWADLRSAYSCTINKSQGSTYDTVFIDLDDIKACNSPNQIARMLYVAVSRARQRVVFVGDLI